MAPAFREGIVDVDGLPTHVLTCGGWLDELGQQQEVVVCVPGNPGLGGYYADFLASVHDQLKVPVWVVSHAGHVVPPNRRGLPALATNKHRYNLEGQVAHKRAFLEAYVPPGAKVHLVGHSIGCKVIMELLKDEKFRAQVSRSYLLFPTIERLAASPNGRFLTSVLRITSVIIFLSWIFTLLPSLLQNFLVSCYFLIKGQTRRAVDTTVKLIHPVALRNIFYLGADEMKKVVELDEAALQEFGDKLYFYYGANDNWTPLSYCHELRDKYPHLKVEICSRNFDHAFVLKTNKEMGEVVARLIKFTE